MLKPAIALYLGETYASIGLFDQSGEKTQPLAFEKSVFLPQVSLKNLLNQTALQLKLLEPAGETPVQVFIVTKYFDRLKQFRLGGSISQVILKGFENSYTLQDSKTLSLAAAQLIISLESGRYDEELLTQEFDRIKKINPDLNKVVISLPEESATTEEREKLEEFFRAREVKVFHNLHAHNQNELRKTLLNAGSEGTKEEVNESLKEAFGPATEINYFCHNGFQKTFENCELFHSAHNFFAHSLKHKKISASAFFDIECFLGLTQDMSNTWNSPWGPIPVPHFRHHTLGTHPFAELRLNQLSMLSFDPHQFQLEPGPVLAGRAIKPLVLDLFYQELSENEFCSELFAQISTPALRAKIQNLFSALEKGQKSSLLYTSIDDLKQGLIEKVQQQVELICEQKIETVTGPLASLFKDLNRKSAKKEKRYSWPQEIIELAGVRT